ncbi:MAG: hypothetical protein UY81_C0011G0020 [Candidatus Giovannonibacteria bacterium GW2011_GWA2_53_7]|uniref:PrgI family protein n=1 Tax=Candidatus Giovannonibacteria bacterium GW2011_GWA2_53_7 TaxID=1618650 RepID=A0A0G1Y125_9BACT|nr:MAG: hypothetical protein UY81_C0011G0020 [Candidatus Giovannonibacteria bacterium GW2011_GWA2_53_7]
MADQFVVPQFIDAEDKILGPITVRQFVIMLIAGLFATLAYRLFDFTLFLLSGVPLVIGSAILAFLKINGVSVHFFILNLIQTFRRPQLRVWDKTITDQQLHERMKADLAPVVQEVVRKAPLSSSHLQDLSLIVNTGGVFNPDETS